VLAALGPGRLLAFSLDGGTPSWRPGEHEVARWCRMLAECGIPADPTALGLAPPPVTSPAPGAVVVHAGAADPARYWPVERFAVVAAALAARGHRVVLTGTRAERHRVAAVATGAGLPPSAVLAGRTDLTGLAALVAGARLVVSVDTGVAHLATAYRTRSVVLFGPVPPHEWGPPADPRHAVLYREAGLARIGVGEVLAAVDRQLDGAGEAGRGGDDPDPPATPAASAGAGR
jgi:ADP-heptose:LPS heptosyltransferase